jgi:hypothetical protein
MKLKKHKGFTYTLTALLLLLFNGVCLAATVSEISLENCQFANRALFQNPAQAVEETSLLPATFEANDNDFSLRHPTPNRLLKKDNSNSISFEYQDWRPKFSFVSYNPLLKPAYYHLLFRHNLF